VLHQSGLSQPESPIPQFTDEPKFPEFVCLPSEQAAGRYYTEGTFGHGSNPDASVARLIAVAEMVERLSLANPDTSKIETARYSGRFQRADPALFCPHTEAELGEMPGYRRALHETAYQWWPAHDRTSGRPVAIPAQRVFLRLDSEEDFQIRRERNCTGGAVGQRGTDQAFRTGLFESLERYTAARCYLDQRPPLRIVDLPAHLAELADYMGRYRLKPHIFDTATDLDLPAVMVLTVDESGVGPAIGLGARCAATYEEAIRRALLESMQGRRAARLDKEARFPGPVDDRTLEDRIHYWSGLERLRDLRPKLESPLRVSYLDVTRRDTTPEVVETRLCERGYHLFVADVTLPEVAAQGFEVLKVVVPELLITYAQA